MRLFVLLLCISAAACTCGKKCDPYAVASKCQGNTRVYCQGERAYGIDWGSHMVEQTCGDKNLCAVLQEGAVTACVRAPVSPCDIETFKGFCDGELPVWCGSPNVEVTDSYVVTAEPCGGGFHCAMRDDRAECVANR